MGDRLIKSETLTDIANAIREKKESSETIPVPYFATEIRGMSLGDNLPEFDGTVDITDGTEPLPDAFTNGYEEGYAEGNTAGVEAGKKSAYDEFWDNYQDYGKRTHYASAFCGFGWNEINFKPKYNMTPQYANGMFQQFGKRIDLVRHLESLGITIDISKADNADSVFYNSYFTHIGVVDFTGCKRLSDSFSYCNWLTTIDKIIINENVTFKTPFVNCGSLVEVRFEGVIGQNGLSFQWSPLLSKASITNIINCLSTTTSGLSVTLSKTAVESAFGSTTSEEWTTLIDTRSNWTINLI